MVEKNDKPGYKMIIEKFCSVVNDNVVVIQTVFDDRETYTCLSSDLCDNCENCKAIEKKV